MTKLKHEAIETHFLYPCVIYSHAKPTIVTTILGTCVAVCLYDPISKKGGINHYMLPLWNGDGLASPKYGNIAIPKLIKKMLAMGCRKSNIQAKVFGGKSEGQGNISLFRIGERNSELALLLLGQENIPIVGSSLNGKYGRRIQFNTGTGEVLMNFLNNI